ncbi:General secretion pathway protein GspD [Dokdonella koreensis DS-123]|uniref:General secretion pathway protein GspD n=1 Tax=Dokdonella koreensis DS-123 TaxID=1300342 RepID=A0A160DRL1_9GAMM|nr:General secretion pathway protein GspD [Dokdonella koreensis DS-123]
MADPFPGAVKLMESDVLLKPKSLLIALSLALLAGCATTPTPRATAPDDGPMTADNAIAPVSPRHEVDAERIGDGAIPINPDEDASRQPPKPEIQVGTGRFFNEQAARGAGASVAGEGQVVFNFENQPIQAVVKAILGDLLQENYIIAPNVGGNVTFSTSKPIRPEDAMSTLETLLQWTGNTLVREGGRYTVLQLKDAIPGKLTPRIAPPDAARGYELRVFPLRYVSPSQMANLLKPYAKPEAVINVDTARSLLVMAGTASELVNYKRTIETFDVDWLKGMSMGVYALQHQEVGKILPELQKLFGAEGESPLAGMFRFMPLESVNSVIVITPQPEYLEQAEQWLRRLDTGAAENATQLYTYDVKNIKAVDLADYLSDIFGTSGGGGGRRGTSGSVAPGLKPVTVGSIGGAGGSSMSYGSNRQNAQSEAPKAESTPRPAGSGGSGEENKMRITAIEENNQLLVMATPAEWDSVQAAIRKLDIAPLQVHIETKILEVSLDGDLQYGVQWWFAGLQGEGYPNGEPYVRTHDRQRGLIGDAGPAAGSSTIFWSYLNSKFQVALSALQSSGVAKVLSAPSLVVTNNQEAQINVGQQIPVQQTFYTGYTVPTTGTNNTPTTTNSGYGTVQYLNTGIILQVKPRVNPGGLVYMEVSQEVSNPGTPTANGNPPINQRQLQTQIAVQSGESVLLGGLISENSQEGESNVPGLSKIPLLGKLFGNTQKRRQRTELIVVITPQVIANSQDARTVTDEYRRQFESLRPLPKSNVTVEPLRPAAETGPVPERP